MTMTTTTTTMMPPSRQRAARQRLGQVGVHREGIERAREGAVEVLIKTHLHGNVREVWVPKGKLLAGPIATLLEQDTPISPPGTITHITRMF